VVRAAGAGRSQAYRDLVDNERMLPYLEEILGDPSWGHAPPLLPQVRKTPS
jgi:hypothetical protein